MYILALALWLIDVRNVIAEINLTLLSHSTDTLDNIYSAAVSDVLRQASYQAFLYAFLVSESDRVSLCKYYWYLTMI